MLRGFVRVTSLMEGTSHSSETILNTLVTLPIEVLVHIVSFLPTRDKVRIRCISRKLRSISEVPSLWEDFIWSRYAPRDEKLLKHVLRLFGKHVKHFHFAGHIAPSEIEVMLKHCKNVIHLSLPSFDGDFDRLEKIVRCMGNIQILDVVQPIRMYDKIRQYLALASNFKELSLRHARLVASFNDALRQWLKEWANLNYTPKKLNILVPNEHVYLDHTSSLHSCVSLLKTKPLQTMSGIDTSACCNIYLTDYSASICIPHVQLKVTDSSVVLSSVKASKYGILGLDCDVLNLTEGSYRGKKVQRAKIIKADVECMDTSIVSLTSVTYFDASRSICSGRRGLYPGHLEQLSIACPNLQRLNLSNNFNCLNNLQGLCSLAANCKSLQGLSLKCIHLHDTEYSCIELWEILCSLRLTELAIEPCLIKQCGQKNAKLSSVASSVQEGSAVWQRLNHMFQRYTSLHLLEVGTEYGHSRLCPLSDGKLLLLTKFPSITSYRLDNLPSNNCSRALKRIFDQKYLRCLFLSKTSSGTLSLSMDSQCSSLQQLYIFSANTVPTEAFIETLCSHGGLEHVLLYVKSLTHRNIENIIENSSNLVTFHVYLYARAFLESQLKQLTAAIKVKFSKRRLFNGGSFTIKVSQRALYLDVNNDTDLVSVWNY